MPKQLPDVLELEKLANDLEASIPRLPAEDPSAYSAGKLLPDCPKHPFRVKDYCQDCAQEERDNRTALELVAQRQAERSRREAEALKQYADEIARDKVVIGERLAAAYLAQDATQLIIGNEATQPYADRVSAEVDSQMFDEALREIRKGEA